MIYKPRELRALQPLLKFQLLIMPIVFSTFWFVAERGQKSKWPVGCRIRITTAVTGTLP